NSLTLEMVDQLQAKLDLWRDDPSIAAIFLEGAGEKPMLGRYVIAKELGKGAMGAVYLGHDPKIGRTVAIKTMDGDPAMIPIRVRNDLNLWLIMAVCAILNASKKPIFLSLSSLLPFFIHNVMLQSDLVWLPDKPE
ncbi:MAG: hypothetical protein P8Y37_12100, partial [Anaerolineales bacterium]